MGVWLGWVVGGGGGGVLEPNPRTGVLWRIWSKICGSLAYWCIKDSLSHTMYVETNKLCIKSKCIEVYEGFHTSV